METNAEATYSVQDRIADDIGKLLHAVPRDLQPVTAARFPLLAALASYAPRIARDLAIAAACVHQEADERRTAEYLLRHRDLLTLAGRPAGSLVSAARCA